MPKRDTILKNVRKLMEGYPECRDSDKKLIWRYWEFEGSLVYSIPSENYITEDRFLNMTTSTARIIRCRALIQNDTRQPLKERLLPTDWNVARQRRIEEKDWREYMGCKDSLFSHIKFDGEGVRG